MKKIFSLFLSLILLTTVLCACNSSQQSLTIQLSEEYEQYPQYVKYYGTFRCGDEGCFQIRILETDSTSGQYMFYSPDGISNYIPLCTRPDCSHNTIDCNASVDGGTFGIYNNQIYYVTSEPGEFVVCRMNIDGTEHEEVVRFPFESDCSYLYRFDRNYLYFTLYTGKTEKLARIKLEKGEEIEFFPVDNFRYDNSFLPNDSILYFSGWINDVKGLYRCSFEDYSIIKVTDKKVPGRLCEKDKVYYLCQGDDQSDGHVCGFYEWDLSTQQSTLMKEFEKRTQYASVLYTNDYIFVEEYGSDVETPYFYVFDRDYELVSVSPNQMPCSKRSPGLLAYTGKYLLLADIHVEDPQFYISEDDFTSYPILYEFDGYNFD